MGRMNNVDDKLHVDMVLDLICVHSYIGFTRLERAVARWREQGGDIEIRFAPFELAPGAPTTGSPLLEALEQTFGAAAAGSVGHLAAAATQDGLELHYERAIATGTFGAHTLVARAARQNLAEQAVERLFRAHFTDGLNIGDPHTLDRLAEELGVTSDDAGVEQQVREGLRLVREAGATSVPIVRFMDGRTFVGEQPEEVYWNAIQAAARPGADPEPDADGVENSKVPWVSSHIQQYLATGGEVGHDYYGYPSLLLTYKGRRSGKLYRTALIYGRDGDSFVVAGSNGAKPRNPLWYENLMAEAEAMVQVKTEKFTVTARPATPDERERLWPLMTGIFPQYLEYEKQTTREIPVVVLDPRQD